MARSKKATTPQAKRFGVAAKAARKKCMGLPVLPGKKALGYFQCIGEEMSSAIKGRRKAKRK
jgi:hypothetical protein